MCKKFTSLVLLTIVFSFLIFFLKSYFFIDSRSLEEQHIEPVGRNYEEVESNHEHEHTHFLSADEKEALQDKFVLDAQKTAKTIFFYRPTELSKKVSGYKLVLSEFLESSVIEEKRDKDVLKVELYEKKGIVRGKMKNQTLKMFGVPEMKKEEFLSVAIHEFAHYMDIYLLKKSVLKDLSFFFYDISWTSTKVLRPGQKQQDFVSGYAMTNKYEDFAESLTYYILHNDSFFKKTKKSPILYKKYLFFQEKVFRDGEFEKTNFSNENILKNYYWDITKIDIDLKKLLQYLKK